MSDCQEIRPAKQPKTQGQQLQSITDDARSGDESESQEAGEHLDESTTSCASDDSEDISTSEAESSSSEDDEDEEEMSSEGRRNSRLITGPTRESNLQLRLQEFLPRLQQANAELDGAEDFHDKRIDQVPDDAEHYIEMDLGLGVLTEQGNEAEKVKIPKSGYQDDHAGGEGADESKVERPIGDSQAGNKANKRKIEELG